MSPDVSILKKSIQGNWVAFDTEFDGVRSSDHIGVDATEEEHRAFVQQYRYVFQEDHFQAGRSDAMISGTFEIDTSSIPAAIDFDDYEGELLPIHGIVKIEGDRVVLCIAVPGEERPKSFHSPPGSSAMVFYLKRE